MAEKWDFNASTGNNYLRILDNGRIVRMGSKPPYLYKAEFWGDYSLKFPENGAWRETLQRARADLRRIAAENAEETCEP